MANRAVKPTALKVLRLDRRASGEFGALFVSVISSVNTGRISLVRLFLGDMTGDISGEFGVLIERMTNFRPGLFCTWKTLPTLGAPRPVRHFRVPRLGSLSLSLSILMFGTVIFVL
jgi:hypothetical protein